MTEPAVQIARLEVRLDAVESDVRDTATELTAIHTELAAIHKILDEARGQWRGMVVLGGFVAALAATITYTLTWFNYAR